MTDPSRNLRAAEPRPAFNPGNPPPTQLEEDDAVYRLMLQAERSAGKPETYTGGAVSAYVSLAESRGVPLERVIRKAVRGELADIVRLPAQRCRSRNQRRRGWPATFGGRWALARAGLGPPEHDDSHPR